MEKAALYNVQSSITLIIRILLCEKATGVPEGKPGLQGDLNVQNIFLRYDAFCAKKELKSKPMWTHSYSCRYDQSKLVKEHSIVGALSPFECRLSGRPR